MFLKRFAITILALGIFASATPTVLAQNSGTENAVTSEAISPRFEYVSNAYSKLSISGNSASVTGYVQKTPAATKIKITTTLLCDGKSVNSWSTPTSTTSSSATIRKTVTLSKHGSYEVKTTYSVTGPNGTETNTCYSDTVNY